MQLGGFEVLVPEAKETSDGYGHIPHNTRYCIKLSSKNEHPADATVTIDGNVVGTWRVEAHGSITVNRPIYSDGIFTFYALGTDEAKEAEIEEDENAGLVSVIFHSGNFVPEVPKDPNILYQTSGVYAGGTGLSGTSKQQFRDVEPLDYFSSAEVTITLLLVAASDIRPLKQKPLSTPIPPPVTKKVAEPAALPRSSRSMTAIWVCALVTVVALLLVARSHPFTEYPTALCRDSSFSYAATGRGACSWHGGVAAWHPAIPWWKRIL